MRFLGVAVLVLGVAACSKKDETPAVDTTAVAPAAAAPAAPAPLALSDVAGTWAVTGKNEAGDSTLVSYDLTATGDTTGWTIKFPNRKAAVPVRVVSVGGDSIVTASGPYESVLRKGVQVTTDVVMRMKDGKLVGRTVAHYAVKTADSVRVIVTEGTKK